MAMPSRNFGDLLVADWAEAVLFLPEVREPSSPFKGAFHVNIQSFLIVVFPLRVVWISFPLNLHMPLYGCGSSVHEIVFSPLHFPVEHPIVAANGCEVLLLNPRFGLVWMSSFGPPSQYLVDGIVYGGKDFLAHHVLVVLCPSSNNGIEQEDELASR